MQKYLTIALAGLLPFSSGWTHSSYPHCPPGEVVKNVLLDSVTGASGGKNHFAPIAIKFKHRNHHWHLKMSFLPDLRYPHHERVKRLRETVIGTPEGTVKKIDRRYYCHYPSLSKNIRLMLYTTFFRVLPAYEAKAFKENASGNPT